MDKSDGYRDQAMPQGQRIERLENAVAKFSARRFYEAIRWGLILLLAGVGVGATAFGVSFIVTAAYDGGIEEARATDELEQHRHDRAQERADRVPAEEQARTRVRQECESACQSAGLGVERARVVADGDHWRLAQCSCVGENGRRNLWNDLRSRESILRGQCADGCAEAGMGLSRAILREQEGELRSVACACVDDHSHRALWDDRPRSEQLCELSSGVLRCDLEEQPQEILFVGTEDG